MLCLRSRRFQYPPAGQSPCHLSDPHRLNIANSDPSRVNITPPLRPHQKAWESCLNGMTEVKIEAHSHINISACTSNTIDRMFVSTARSALVSLVSLGGILKSAMDWYCDGLSDHAPIFWQISVKHKERELPPRVRSQWCKHPEFSKHVQAGLAHPEIRALPLMERLAITKVLFVEGSNRARDASTSSQDKEHPLVVLAGVARCVWESNGFVAKKLRDSTLLGAQHVGISMGTPYLLDPPAFESQFLEAKSRQVEKRRVSLAASSQTRLKNLRSSYKLDLLEKKAALWRPAAPYLAVSELVLSREEAEQCGLGHDALSLVDPVEIKKALGDIWSHTFARSAQIPNMAYRFIDNYCAEVKWDWESVVPPSVEDIEMFLKDAKDSAPGWDGIPFAAWYAGGEHAFVTLHDLVRSQIANSPPPRWVQLRALAVPTQKETSQRFRIPQCLQIPQGNQTSCPQMYRQ